MYNPQVKITAQILQRFSKWVKKKAIKRSIFKEFLLNLA